MANPKSETLPQMSIDEMFAGLKKTNDDILTIHQNRISKGKEFAHQHFILYGITNRMLAQTRAFKHSVEDRNGLVATALLRLQLDTALRLYALFWVADPNAFSEKVFKGTQIDRLKAADGEQMTDKYLRGKLVSQYPWVDDVYKQSSGAIHFSNRHIFDALSVTDDKTGECKIQLGPNKPDQPIEEYSEYLTAFLHINMIIVEAVRDWFERFDVFVGTERTL